MITIQEWAARWNLPPQALAELAALHGVADAPVVTNAEPLSEGAVQQNIRLEASRVGARLWRNNVGACTDKYGTFIRYGLANDSIAVNKAIKSSDLIGIKPVMITFAHVGQVFGQFTAREVKREGWQYTGNGREKAQLKFLELVTALGGDGRFATGEGTL